MTPPHNHSEDAPPPEQACVYRSVPAGQSGETPLFWAELWDWMKSIAVALVLVFLIHQFVFNLSTVRGHSMEPTLAEGEWLFINKIGYLVGEPQLGDIVIFKDPDPLEVNPQYLVKRVVGVAGDKVEIHRGQLYRNGVPVDEPYTDTAIQGGEFAAVRVGEDQLFVMGDNRHRGASKDSRVLGTIPESRVKGRAQLILWPISRWAVLGRQPEGA